MTSTSDPKRRAWRTIIRRSGIIASSLLVVLVVIHVSLALAWGRDLRAAQARLAAAGLPMAPGQVIPTCLDADNAAPLYLKAFVLLTLDSGKLYSSTSSGKLGPEFDRVYDLATTINRMDPSTWTQAERDDALAILEGADFTRIRTLVEQAVARPRCCFDIGYDKGPSTLLPHINIFRDAARLFACRARLLALTGRLSEAAEAHRLILGFGRQQRETPFPICQLVGISIDSIAINSLHRSLDAGLIPDESLPALAVALEAMDARAAMVASMDGERLLLGEWVFDAAAKGRSGTTFNAVSFDDAPRLGFVGGLLYGSFLGAPLLAKDHAFYLDCIGEMRRRIEHAETAAKRPEVPSWALLTGMLLPAGEGFSTSLETQRVNVDLARMAVALRRAHARDGAYPDQLGSLSPLLLASIPAHALKDGSYQYQRLGDGFSLSAEPEISMMANQKKQQHLKDAWTWTAGPDCEKPAF